MTVMMQDLPSFAEAYPREVHVSAEQERIYIARLQAGHDEEAQERLLLANIGLIRSIARPLCGQGIELEDLVQEGCIGLLDAANKFDLSRPFRFSTYVTWKLRRVMLRAIENYGMLIRLPTYQHALMKRLKRDDEEVLNDYPAEQIAEVQRAMRYVLSLDVPLYNESGELTLIDVLSEDDLTEETALQSVQRQELQTVLGNTLTEREYQLLMYRFGLADDQERSLGDVGKQLNLSHEHVRQLVVGALAKIKQTLLAQAGSNKEGEQ